MGRRNYALTLILSLITFNVFAQGIDGDFIARNQVYEMDKFDKGQYSNVNPHSLPADAAIKASNIRANINVGSLNKRPAMLLYGTIGKSYPVKSVNKFYQSNGNKYLIATVDDSIYSGNDNTGALTLIRDSLTSGKRWNFVTYKDILIGSNGYDNIQKWDGSCDNTADNAGSRSAGSCTADLGAPFASQAAGAGLTAGKWYQYKIAYFDGTNYSFSSAKSNPILTGASTNKQISLTNIPLGSLCTIVDTNGTCTAGTTQRLIYRTVGDASKAAVLADTSYYLVAVIVNNYTMTFTDTYSDATILADNSPKWSTVSLGINATPPHGKYLSINKERIWAANDPSTSNARSYVYFSENLYQDYWLPSSNYFNIRPDDGDEITFLKTFLGTITVGKTNTISKIYTDTYSTTRSNVLSTLQYPSQWQVSPVISFIGCAAPYSAVETPFGILYLGRDGVYGFDGQSSKLYTDRVTDVIRDINQVNLNDIAAAFYQNEYHMSYTSKIGGSAVNDKVLVFDSVRDAFEVDTKNIDSLFVSKAGSDYGALIMGSSNSDGKVYLAQQVPTSLEYKTKSGLAAGTTTDVDIMGTEDAPWLQLGWGKTWAQMTGTWASQTGTWMVHNQTGYWYSPIVQVNAQSLSKLYWNQILSAGNTVTFALRTGDTVAAVNAAGWSSEFSNNSGADVSGVSGKVYVQLRATLKTTDYISSPVIPLIDNFNIKLAYSQQGTTGETSFLTYWQSGFNGFLPQYDGYQKRIRAIDVHYTGTSGTITIGLKNSEGTIDTSFQIDLSRVGTGNPGDPYGGDTINKTFHWEPPANSLIGPTPIGEYWMVSVSETGITPWTMQKQMYVFDVLPRHNP